MIQRFELSGPAPTVPFNPGSSPARTGRLRTRSSGLAARRAARRTARRSRDGAIRERPGPYHSNHCHRNLVKILLEIIKILLAFLESKWKKPGKTTSWTPTKMKKMQKTVGIRQKSRNFTNFLHSHTLSNEFGEIPRNFHQNLCEIR